MGVLLVKFKYNRKDNTEKLESISSHSPVRFLNLPMEQYRKYPASSA
jgi:hypothetical protein